ncbi:MAG: hypothetical protein KAZ75_02370, partial [Acinetobacter sp.]|nr:hypothetical protein [Acinetobacter sp.]
LMGSSSATTPSVNSGATSASTTVKTTVTQRDAQGNVVSVQQNHSTPPAPSNAEKIKENSDTSRREISDPFN